MNPSGTVRDKSVALFVAGILLGLSGMAIGFAMGVNIAPASTPSTNPPVITPPGSAPMTVTVDMASFVFAPETVTIKPGDSVKWVNKDPVYHTVTSDDAGGPLQSPNIESGQTFSHTFASEGEYYYHCIPHAFKDPISHGPRGYTGMVGLVKVVASGGSNGTAGGREPLPPPRTVDAPEIGRSPADVPPPITRTTPTTVEVFLEAKLVTAAMDTNVTYTYWTFNGTVPGPMIRVMVNDTVVVHLKNSDASMTHSIDLHAVMGPGGGAAATQAGPGETKSFQFKAMRVGLYVYHCATPPVDWHIANGMYGLIVVEPEGGLAPVDREFYVMQGDFYTNGNVGEAGHHSFSPDKLHLEQPTYVVFNGRKGSLVDAGRQLTANVNDTVRIFFGVGGPNLVSSFHVIGQIFDRVYPEGDLVGEPHYNVQTTLVPAGGAAVVEFVTLVPGTYVLVDHSISRTIYRGSLGLLSVEGPQAPDIFQSLP